MMYRYADHNLLIRFNHLWWLIQRLRLVINPSAHHDRLGVHNTLYIAFLYEPATKYALTIQVNRRAARVETKLVVITSDTDLLIIRVIKIVSLPQIERDSANCVAGHDSKRFKSRHVAFRKRDPDRVGKDSAIVVA